MLLKVLREVLGGQKPGLPVNTRVERSCACPICRGNAKFLAALDFNKNCEGEKAGLSPTGEMVDYFLCPVCAFCFAPAMYAWSADEFMHRVYNDDYIRVDPEYSEKRPQGNMAMLEANFGHCKERISHLDFGGGNGFLSRRLVEVGWRSRSYDPLADHSAELPALGRYELVTAFEVFEHVPDVDALMMALQALLKENGLILFSTLLSDGNIDPHGRLDWWYAAPRNGHISLFSSTSLALLLERFGFQLKSFTPAMHAAYVQWPDWMSQ